MQGTEHNDCSFQHTQIIFPIHMCAHVQSRELDPGFSILEVNTKKVNQLPLRDFAAADTSRSGQEFGFVMGPACFY